MNIGKIIRTRRCEKDMTLDVRDAMVQKRYDFVRDTDAFCEILASLDEYAGQWDEMEKNGDAAACNKKSTKQ